MAITAPARHCFTVDEFDRLGVFSEDDRVELLEGEVVDMAPIGARHASSVDYLTNVLPVQLVGEAIVRVQSPIRISDLSEPLPDVSLLRLPRTRYVATKPVPEDVLLVIEVADSNVDYGRVRKADLYAAAAIPEYWVVDLVSNEVLVMVDPVAGTYESSVTARPGEGLVPRLLPRVSLPVSEILCEC